MDERAHDDHFHAVRGCERTETFGNITFLRHQLGELALYGMPRKE